MPNFEGGGAERMMIRLASGMERHCRVDLVVANSHGPLRAEVPGHVRCIDLGSRGVVFALPRFVRYLRRVRPIAVIATLPHANIVAVLAARLSGAAIQVFVREASTPSMVETDRWDWRGLVMPFLMRLFYPLADRVIAVSAGVAHDLHEFIGIRPDKIAIIYNPVVDSSVKKASLEQVDHPWLGDSQLPVVLSVGRLGREKDFDTLIRAFALVLRRLPARLLILGEGRERPALEELIRSLGLSPSVQLPGFISNPFPYMAASSVYVLSSKREGLPGALIQALACGCKVVSTDCPSGPSEILQGGEYGELVPVGNQQAMAAAILRALNDEGDRERLKSRAECFSDYRSVRAYLDLIYGKRQGRNGSEAPGRNRATSWRPSSRLRQSRESRR
jgi:glycosyltransferase involved in cell wall biosynthesis